MAFEPRDSMQNTSRGYAAEGSFDAGLQSYMQRVYGVMCFGLVVTGLTAFGVTNSPALMQVIFGTPLKWVAIFAPIAIEWFGLTPQRVMRMSSGAIRGWLLVLSVIYGVCFACVFHVFTAESIARVFFITAGMFAAVSIYGYTTKKNLARVGAFMFMGAVGVVIASIVNIFIASTVAQFVISVIGVICFTGLAAWQTQMLKECYSVQAGESANEKLAVMGALALYLSFIAMFINLLHLFGVVQE